MRAVRSRRSKFTRPSSLYLYMRAAVMVVGPMPSPRKKMMFLAWVWAKAWVVNAAASSAQSRIVFIVVSLRRLPAGRFFNQRKHAGIVDGAAEELRTGARRAQVDIGAAMGLGLHANRRFLVVVVGADDGI